ncbi:MAG: esterase/lipase, partial [Nocardioidaceae bacterium]|nr:esterase/lipase [Nocardioidaceae bacterium]
MALSLDPAFAAVLGPSGDSTETPGMASAARGDALALRAAIDADADAAFSVLPDFETVTSTRHRVDVGDAEEMEVRWYTAADVAAGPAVVYLHGGGLIGGTLDNYEPSIKFLVDLTGVPFLHVGYRLAPEHRGISPAADALA